MTFLHLAELTYLAAALKYGDVFFAIKDRTVVEVPTPELSESTFPMEDPTAQGAAHSLSDEAEKVAESNKLEDLTRATGDFAVYKYYFGRVGWVLMGSFLVFNATEAFSSSFSRKYAPTDE